MPTRQQIIDAAFSYVGTPYRDAGQTKEDGLSCAGLLVCIGRDLGIDVSGIPGFAEFNAAEPMDKWLEMYADKLESIDDALPGDIVTALHDSMAGTDQHCAVVRSIDPRGVRYWYFIHALRNIGVCEGRFFGRYLRGVRSAWRLKGVVD